MKWIDLFIGLIVPGVMKSCRSPWQWSSCEIPAGSLLPAILQAQVLPTSRCHHKAKQSTCMDVQTKICHLHLEDSKNGGSQSSEKVWSFCKTVDCPLTPSASLPFPRIQDLWSHPDPSEDSAGCRGAAGAQLHRRHWAQRGHWIQLDALWSGPGQYSCFQRITHVKTHHI